MLISLNQYCLPYILVVGGGRKHIKQGGETQKTLERSNLKSTFYKGNMWVETLTRFVISMSTGEVKANQANG